MEIKFTFIYLSLILLTGCGRSFVINRIDIDKSLQFIESSVYEDNWIDYRDKCEDGDEGSLVIENPNYLTMEHHFNILLRSKPESYQIKELESIYRSFENNFKSSFDIECFRSYTSEMIACMALFHYFEELLFAWNQDIISIKSKRKIAKKFIQKCDCKINLETISRRDRSYSFIGYGDIELNIKKCKNEIFNFHSKYYKDTLSSFRPVYVNFNNFNRYEMHSDVISELTFNATKDRLLVEDESNWEEKILYFDTKRLSRLRGVFITHYSKFYSQSEYSEVALMYIKRWEGGGKKELEYLASLSDDEVNFKVLNYYFKDAVKLRPDYHIWVQLFYNNLSLGDKESSALSFETFFNNYYSLTPELQSRIIRCGSFIYNDAILDKVKLIYQKSEDNDIRSEIEKRYGDIIDLDIKE